MDFAPSDSDWRKIENAYGRAWDGEARGEIVALVKEYLLYEPFERNAPFVDDALTWISRVERHARAFWNATHDSHSHKAKMIREAAWAAEFAIVDNLTTLLLGESDQWRKLIGVMTDVVSALAITKKELKKG